MKTTKKSFSGFRNLISEKHITVIVKRLICVLLLLVTLCNCGAIQSYAVDDGIHSKTDYRVDAYYQYAYEIYLATVGSESYLWKQYLANNDRWVFVQIAERIRSDKGFQFFFDAGERLLSLDFSDIFHFLMELEDPRQEDIVEYYVMALSSLLMTMNTNMDDIRNAQANADATMGWEDYLAEGTQLAYSAASIFVKYPVISEAFSIGNISVDIIADSLESFEQAVLLRKNAENYVAYYNLLQLTIDNTTDENLKKAAKSLQTATGKCFKYYTEHLVSDYLDTTTNVLSDSFFDVYKEVEVLENDPDCIKALHGLSKAVEKINYIKLGADYIKVVYDVILKYSDSVLRDYEILAMAEIRRALISEINRINTQIKSPEDYAAIKKNCELLEDLLYVTLRGEYCAYMLYTREAAYSSPYIEDWFNGFSYILSQLKTVLNDHIFLDWEKFAYPQTDQQTVSTEANHKALYAPIIKKIIEESSQEQWKHYQTAYGLFCNLDEDSDEELVVFYSRQLADNSDNSVTPTVYCDVYDIRYGQVETVFEKIQICNDVGGNNGEAGVAVYEGKPYLYTRMWIGSPEDTTSRVELYDCIEGVKIMTLSRRDYYDYNEETNASSGTTVSEYMVDDEQQDETMFNQVFSKIEFVDHVNSRMEDRALDHLLMPDNDDGGEQVTEDSSNHNDLSSEGKLLGSGRCGADGGNLTWRFYEDGSLVIEGSGKMADYRFQEGYPSQAAPWLMVSLSTRTEIERVEIASGVTSIGNCAFATYYCGKLKTIDIPDTVTQIGTWAFSFLTGLKSITLPASIQHIGGYAFGETGLTDVYYMGSEEEWNAVEKTVKDGIGIFSIDPTIHYLTETKSLTDSRTSEIGELPSAASVNTVSENNIFSLLPSKFTFTSGIGAWATDITLNDDGTFTGVFEDSDMGDTGNEYPDGTVYYCNFSGKFSQPRCLTEYIYSVRLEEITVESATGSEKYENNTRYIAAEPYGFENADEFLVYLPGCPIDEVSEEFIRWSFINTQIRDTIPMGMYGLYNLGGEEGFVGKKDSIWGRIYRFAYNNSFWELSPSYYSKSKIFFSSDPSRYDLCLTFDWNFDEQTEFLAKDLRGESGDYHISIVFNDDSTASVTITSVNGYSLEPWGGSKDGVLTAEFHAEIENNTDTEIQGITPTGLSSTKPGPQDLAGQDGVAAPTNGWLPDSVTKYVKGTTSGNAYLRWSPSNEGREYNRYVKEGEKVAVLAVEGDYSLVKSCDGRLGWVTSRLLSE